MTSNQMVSVSPIWQLEHVEKGADMFAGPPYLFTQEDTQEHHTQTVNTDTN